MQANEECYEYESGVISNCCGKRITSETGTCSGCKEPCDPEAIDPGPYDWGSHESWANWQFEKPEAEHPAQRCA